MANTRLGLTNWLFQPGAVLKNGTGGGAPALSEVSPYVMAHLLVADRYTFWRSATLPDATAFDVDFDLGSPMEVDAAGLLGSRLVSGGEPSSVELYSNNTAYPGVPGDWTFRTDSFVGTIADRDSGATISSVTARWWRFRLNADQDWALSLGKFFLGKLTDLGGIHSPGGLQEPFQNRLETPLVNGATVLTGLGDDGGTLVMPWNLVLDAIRQHFLTAQRERGAIVVVDADGKWQEMFLRNGKVSVSRPSFNLYDINAELVRLP
jgi:hypothetical protein